MIRQGQSDEAAGGRPSELPADGRPCATIRTRPGTGPDAESQRKQEASQFGMQLQDLNKDLAANLGRHVEQRRGGNLGGGGQPGGAGG